MEYELYTFSNSMRIVYTPVAINTGVSHCCLMVRAGARDESPEEVGMAHFAEHMLFKGTAKRNTVQILNRLETVGGDLNAFTTKEYTCITASFLNEYLPRALELISDMIFHSRFPEEEIEKEKEVIGDEIDSYKDIPEEQILDDFEELLFEGHPLGNNILGKKTSITAFQRDMLLSFHQKHYKTSNMILGFSGHIAEKKFLRSASRYFGESQERRDDKLPPPETLLRVKQSGAGYLLEKLKQKKAQTKKIAKPINQVHAILGGPSYSLYEEEKLGMLFLNNLLGGTGMSSRLNLEIREKTGICYSIESNYTALRDTGLFSIYFGTDSHKSASCLRLVHKELYKLCKEGLSDRDLRQAKQKFKGQIALAEENRASVLLSICKGIMDYGKADSLPEMFAKIDSLGSAELLGIARKQFDPSILSTLIFEPMNPEHDE